MYETCPVNSSFSEVWGDMDGRPGDGSCRGQWFGSMKSARYEDLKHCALQQRGHSDVLHAYLTHELKFKIFRILWPCIVINSLWITPTGALSSSFIIGITTLHVSGSLFHPDPGNTRSPSCINFTYAVARLRSSWWWAERLPETYRVIIPILKLELSASVGLIHKELNLNL
jgi:hypothetical protein